LIFSMTVNPRPVLSASALHGHELLALVRGRQGVP
jgi:hypothetical protein